MEVKIFIGMIHLFFVFINALAGVSSVSANFISENVDECADLFPILPDVDPCQDLWQRACVENLKTQPFPEELNPDNPIVQFYHSEMATSLSETSDFKSYEEAVKKNGDPLLSTDLLQSMRNYHELFKKEGKAGLRKQINRYFTQNAVADIENEDVEEFYHHLRMRVYERFDEFVPDRTGRLQLYRKMYGSHSGPLEKIQNGILTTFFGVDHSFSDISERVLAWDFALEFLTPEELFYEVASFLSISRRSYLKSAVFDSARKQEFFDKLKPNVFTQKANNHFDSLRSQIHATYLQSPHLKSTHGDEYMSKMQIEPLTSRPILQDPEDFYLSGNATYTNSTNSLQFFPNMEYRPEANQLWIMAHEMGHGWYHHHTKTEEINLSRLKGCLRDQAEALADQLNESSADWFATEIMVQWMRSPEKKLTDDQRRDMVMKSVVSCESVGQYSWEDPHLRWDRRSNLIVLAHPYIRELFGCPADPNLKHCEI